MEKAPMISVIIPVYNVEDYLERCLKSVASQDYKQFEVLLIDDGSTDASGVICETWSKKDKRYKCIHKENGGLSEARNTGIKAASGEYLTFIDSDDWVDAKLLSTLLQGINPEVTISACGFYTVRNGISKAWRSGEDKYQVYSSVEAVRNMMYGHSIDTSAWAKLFHKSCFKEVLFPVGHLYEEVATTYRLMLTQNRVSITTRPLYYYVKHPGSIVSSSFSKKHMDMLKFSQDMLKIAEHDYPELIPAARRRIVYACFYLLKTMGREYKKHTIYIQEIMKEYKKYKDNVLRDYAVSHRDKMAIQLLSTTGVGGFELVWAMYSLITGRHGNE